MAERFAYQGTPLNPTPLPQRIEEQVMDIHERVNALITWQLAEGDYELKIPPRPQSAPDTLRQDTTINALDMRYSYIDSLGKKQLVTITRGLTENGSGEGLAEGEDDITIDIKHSPMLYRLRSGEEARMESRLPIPDPPMIPTRKYLEFPDKEDRYYEGYRMIPSESRAFTLADTTRLNAVLDEIGRPGKRGADVKVTETHRNRIFGIWQIRD